MLVSAFAHRTMATSLFVGGILLYCCGFAAGLARPCIPRDFGNDGTVCVCNATYCDSADEVVLPEINTFLRYTSSRNGLRLHKTNGSFTNESVGSDHLLIVDTETKYQTIFGFGGAITDAVGINLKSLSAATSENFMRSYFSKEGSDYNFIRIPIAGCDFSVRKYTYADVEDDILLEHFELADEDLIYKIPLVKQALEMNPQVKLVAASWTAPPWMKTNNDYTGFGVLKKKYYQLYADYIMKFLDEYKDYGLEMWAISTGNEPIDGFVPIVRFNSMGWIPSSVATWVSQNLGPTLRASEHRETMILALDDQRFHLPWWVNMMFRNEAAKNYTSGIAVHWYWDSLISAATLDATHNDSPDKFLIMTEASSGDKPWEERVVIGSWARGEKYVLDIIENLQHWVTGWIDWNLGLNEMGGPNWAKNFVDSAVIVNGTSDEFYKQPTYYAVAHFSKFVRRYSSRIGLFGRVSDVESIAFKAPQNETTLVLYNKSTKKQSVHIHDPRRGNMTLELEPQSINTIIYV